MSEGKEPGGLFSRSDTPQSRELKAQSTIATRNDHATGEGKQIPPPQPKKNTQPLWLCVLLLLRSDLPFYALRVMRVGERGSLGDERKTTECCFS